MAESFSNSLTRAAGSVNSASGGAIGVTTNLITGISTSGVSVGDLIDNANYIAGTKVATIGASLVTADRDSTNSGAASSQIVKFLGMTTAFTSASSTKSILIGGTFANLTHNDINIYVEVVDQSLATGPIGVSSAQLASDIPIPNGSSFVISEAGKTILEAFDQVTVYCDTADAVDVNLAILSGVS